MKEKKSCLTLKVREGKGCTKYEQTDLVVWCEAGLMIKERAGMNAGI